MVVAVSKTDVIVLDESSDDGRAAAKGRHSASRGPSYFAEWPSSSSASDVDSDNSNAPTAKRTKRRVMKKTVGRPVVRRAANNASEGTAKARAAAAALGLSYSEIVAQEREFTRLAKANQRQSSSEARSSGKSAKKKAPSKTSGSQPTTKAKTYVASPPPSPTPKALSIDRTIFDGMSFSEVQAQERELARLFNEAKRRNALQSPAMPLQSAPKARSTSKPMVKRVVAPSPDTRNANVGRKTSPRRSRVAKSLARAQLAMSSTESDSDDKRPGEMPEARSRARSKSTSDIASDEEADPQQLHHRTLRKRTQPLLADRDTPWGLADETDSSASANVIVLSADDDESFTDSPKRKRASGNASKGTKSRQPRRTQVDKKAGSVMSKTDRATKSKQGPSVDSSASTKEYKNGYVVPSSAWRGVRFSSAPSSILSVPETTALPFESVHDLPLSAFDPDNSLEEKCKMSFISAQSETSVFAANGDQEAAQEKMNERVREIYETEHLAILECYKRKARAIMQEARERTSVYLESLDAQRKSIRRTLLHPIKMNLPKQERKHAKILGQSCIPETARKLQYVVTMGEQVTSEETLAPIDFVELTSIQSLSRSTTCVGIKSSVRVEDDPFLRYVPYFGDNDDGRDIDIAQYEKVKSQEMEKSSALDDEVNEFVLRRLVAECDFSDRVFQAIKTVAGFSQPHTDYCEIRKAFTARRTAAERMNDAKTLMEAAEESNTERCAHHKLVKTLIGSNQHFRRDSESKTLRERLTPAPTFFESNMLVEARQTPARTMLGLKQTSEYSDLMETYRDLFCRMCYKYDCHEHGIEHPLPLRRSDPYNPPVRYCPDAAVKVSIADQDDKDTESPTDVTTKEGDDTPPSAASVQDVTEGDDDAIVLEPLSDKEADVDMEPKDEEPLQAKSMLSGCRRSGRSLTRASTMATVSWEIQNIRHEKTKVCRAPRSKAVKRENVDESEYIDASHHEMVSSLMKKFAADDEVCGPKCWKNRDSQSKPDATNETSSSGVDLLGSLSQSEALLLQKIRLTIGDNACVIAAMLPSVQCGDVHAHLKKDQQRGPDEEGYLESFGGAKAKSRKRARVVASIRSTNNRDLLKRSRKLKGTGTNHEYEPCNHDGVCDSTHCSCITRDHTCEKACSCSRDCPNRFQGCRCSMGNCRTMACPCFVALRECNPDLCFTCGASEAPVLAYDKDRGAMSAMDLNICCNVNVLRGHHKKIGVSFSSTHGWGAFALEPIKRGDFIYEYTGAMISQDEAERRGSIYDKLLISFLFDLNEDAVVDAVRMGNKSKFANHSSNGQKCKAKILRLGGEHRIAVWAQHDIAEGEELFFDYGYHGESAPDWSQVRITGSSAASRSGTATNR